MRNPPVLSHSGAGQLTITNYRDTKTYGVFTPTGTPQAGTSVVDGVVSMGEVFGEYKVSYTQNPTKGTTFSRLAVTYTRVNEPVWVPCTPPSPLLGCNINGSWTCCCPGENGCRGTPCADGTICCRGCSGGSYRDNWVNKKNPVPAGYTEKHGEWVKIDNPEDTTTAEATPFSSFVDFDDDYYISFTGINPEEDPLVSLIFYDGDDPYAFYSYPTDADNFEFHRPLGGEPELWVKNLSGLIRGSRYELVAYSDDGDTEMFREEGNVA